MKSKVEIPSKLWGKIQANSVGRGCKMRGGRDLLSLSLSLSFVSFAYFAALSFI